MGKRIIRVFIHLIWIIVEVLFDDDDDDIDDAPLM